MLHYQLNNLKITFYFQCQILKIHLKQDKISFNLIRIFIKHPVISKQS